MSEPIKVGDLVQIVRARYCCPEKTAWGHIFVVDAITTANSICIYCGRELGLQATAWTGDWCAAEVERLKRIPPLSELDDVQREEGIHA